MALTERLVGDQFGELLGTAEVEQHRLVGGHDLLRREFELTVRLGFRPLLHPTIMASSDATNGRRRPVRTWSWRGTTTMPGWGPALGIWAGGKAMGWEQRPDELDLTDSGELVSAMSAAVGRLRQLAAAAFNAGPEEPTEVAATQPGPNRPA